MVFRLSWVPCARFHGLVTSRDQCRLSGLCPPYQLEGDTLSLAPGNLHLFIERSGTWQGTPFAGCHLLHSTTWSIFGLLFVITKFSPNTITSVCKLNCDCCSTHWSFTLTYIGALQYLIRFRWKILHPIDFLLPNGREI